MTVFYLYSAKNAWGSNTGYADTLRQQGIDTARAQQLENWHNQQEVLAQRKNQRFMTEDFDKVSTPDEDWRKLASFGVGRTQVRIASRCCRLLGRYLMKFRFG
jgi:hypothetical protein